MTAQNSFWSRSLTGPAIISATLLMAWHPGPMAHGAGSHGSDGERGAVQGRAARAVSQTRPAAPARPSGRRGPKSIAVIDGDPVLQLLPEDGIPPVDQPEMVPASEAGSFMRDDEMVLGIVDPQGEARAYSTWHLDHHEIVNDTLGKTPIAATW